MEQPTKVHPRDALHRARRNLELARMEERPYPELRKLQAAEREAYSGWLDWLNANTVIEPSSPEFMEWTDESRL